MKTIWSVIGNGFKDEKEPINLLIYLLNSDSLERNRVFSKIEKIIEL
jgi:hypothetical protein